MNELKLRLKELAAKAEAVREFAAGDQILKLGFKAAKSKGVYGPEKLAMASQLHGPILSIALTKKQPVPAGVAAWNHPALWNQAKRNAAARQIREYRGVLQRAAKTEAVREFARGDFAIPALKKAGWRFTKSGETQASVKNFPFESPRDNLLAYHYDGPSITALPGRSVAAWGKALMDAPSRARNNIALFLRAERMFPRSTHGPRRLRTFSALTRPRWRR